MEKEYRRWLELAVKDEDLIIELKQMDKNQIEDSFYRNLAFGTGGLRGIIGAGTNRINIYTIAKASQGLANYLNNHFNNPSVSIGYDSRIKSDIFARVASEVFIANSIKVYIYKELMPVPCLSYATRHYNCSAGIMITASHNPSKYNGYKVYGNDGCQITTESANEILNEIEKLDIFNDVKSLDFNEGLNSKLIEYINDDTYTFYIEDVKKESVLYDDEINLDLAIVYSPLNGTGLKPIKRVLEESGFTNITVVKEQEQPDGNFPTCPYPNPEIREAMELGLEYCKKTGADLLLATDPDCDRCGIAVKDNNDYRLLTGNEVGLLLLDYICSQRIKHNKMPNNPVFVKTIVTMDLAEKIANHYNVETINVLTGFKFIGEVIGNLEKEGREKDFICGFEESYGYLTGTYVRDKDGVNAALMICEMFAYYKTRGLSLIDKLNEIYNIYGYCMNTLHSYEFEGSAGLQKMKEIMQEFRKGTNEIANKKVIKALDYSKGLGGLPKSDVIKYILENDCSVVIRPSGTEPKIKTYISVISNDKKESIKLEEDICKELEERILF